MAELDWSGMPIHEAIKADWTSPEILIEGSLNCAKSTVALDKEIDALLRWPGIPILLFRWTDDAVNTKLRPAFEAILNIRNVIANWDAKAKRYELANGSIAYAFGLKAVSAVERYNKLRGLGVHRIMGDQVEEMDRGVAAELRGRLRPDLEATIRHTRFPFQLTFIANPSADHFWLSREFPTDNRVKGRKLYSLSVFDNRHLPQESVESLLRQFPPEHPKHQTMVLGKRGLNITGDPIFEGIFDRELHVKPLVAEKQIGLIEAYEVGKHNPVWVIGQRTRAGAIRLLGGIIGQALLLEEFLPIVAQYRDLWFPDTKMIRTCTGPMGDRKSTEGQQRFSLLKLLQGANIDARWLDTANAWDVRLAMIEYLGSCLLRRVAVKEETLTINADPSRWLVASRGDVESRPFLEHAMMGGYTWSEHYVSVSNKEVRRPEEDDWYANAMHAVEHLALNFCAGQPSDLEAARRRDASDAMAFPDLPDSPHAWMY